MRLNLRRLVRATARWQSSALTPKPAFSSPDRVSVVLTEDSWIGRSGFPVSAALAGSAGFEISAPNPASAHRYVAVCGLVDLTLSSPLG